MADLLSVYDQRRVLLDELLNEDDPGLRLHDVEHAWRDMLSNAFAASKIEDAHAVVVVEWKADTAEPLVIVKALKVATHD